MLSKVFSANLNGIEAQLIEVEVDISNGMPNFEIVGLPDASVKESKDRVKSAIKNSKIDFPIRKIVVNMSPANVRKIGSRFDLPIALGILGCEGKLKLNRLKDYVFIGELSLNGEIKAVNGVLPIINSLLKMKQYKFVVPYENWYEATLLNEAEVIGVKNLKDCLNFINDENYLPNSLSNDNNLDINNEASFGDFQDVCGQELAKRAIQIAAAGRHNCMLIGPPGCGKTMLAKRIVTILPKLNMDEMIKVMELQSLVTIIQKENITFVPPFRNPHHSISTVSLIGGGRIPKPGEISLAHNGVLYLDEITEFKGSALESLRQPLEEKEVVISRLNSQAKFPADFMLLASMNPCPCGYFGHQKIKCKCSENDRKKYLKKISGPLIDRIDLYVTMDSVKYEEINNNKGLKSELIREKISSARMIQQERFKSVSILYNSQMGTEHIKKYCNLDSEASKLLEKAFNNLNLSLRAYNKILKVARTIADYEGSNFIKTDHIEEAVSYRNLKLIEN